MAKIIATDLNLLGSEIQDVRAESLSTPPSDPQPGRFWFDPVLGKFMFRGLDENIDATDRATHFGSQAASTISDLEAVVKAYPINTLAKPANDLDIGGFKLVNVAPGVADTDVATVGQINASASSDREYIDSQDALNSTADQAYAKTYADGLSVDDRAFAVAQDGILKTYVDTQDGLNSAADQAYAKSYADGLSGDDRAYADTQDGILKTYVDTQDATNSAADQAYAKTYADGISVDDRAYTDTAVAGVADNSLSDFAAPTADLSIDGFKLVNVAPGVADTDAATLANSLSDFAPPTADLPIGGFKLTNVAPGVADTDVATVGNSLSDFAVPTAPLDVNGQPIVNVPDVADLNDSAVQTQAVNLQTAKRIAADTTKYKLAVDHVEPYDISSYGLSENHQEITDDVTGVELAVGSLILFAGSTYEPTIPGVYVYKGMGVPLVRLSSEKYFSVSPGEIVYDKATKQSWQYFGEEVVTPDNEATVEQKWRNLDPLYQHVAEFVVTEPVVLDDGQGLGPTDIYGINIREGSLILLTAQNYSENGLWIAHPGGDSPITVAPRPWERVYPRRTPDGVSVLVLRGANDRNSTRWTFNGNEWYEERENYDARCVFTINMDSDPGFQNGDLVLLVNQDDEWMDGLHRVNDGSLQKLYVNAGALVTATSWVGMEMGPAGEGGSGWQPGMRGGVNEVWCFNGERWAALNEHVADIEYSVFSGSNGNFVDFDYNADGRRPVNLNTLNAALSPVDEKVEALSYHSLAKTVVTLFYSSDLVEVGNNAQSSGYQTFESNTTADFGLSINPGDSATVFLSKQTNSNFNCVWTVFGGNDGAAYWSSGRSYFPVGEQIYSSSDDKTWQKKADGTWEVMYDFTNELAAIKATADADRRNTLAKTRVDLVGVTNVPLANQPFAVYIDDYRLEFTAEAQGAYVLLTGQDIPEDNGLWYVQLNTGMYAWYREPPRQFIVGEQVYARRTDATWQLTDAGWVQKYQAKLDYIWDNTLAKVSVEFATEVNVDVTSHSRNIGGHTVFPVPPPLFAPGGGLNPDRKSQYILIAKQDNTYENGIYTVDGMDGSPLDVVLTRDPKLNTLPAGTQVFSCWNSRIWVLKSTHSYDVVKANEPQHWWSTGDSVAEISISTMGKPNADIDMAGYHIVNMGGPSNDNDALNWGTAKLMVASSSTTDQAYADTQDGILKAYVDTQDGIDRAYTDTAIAGVTNLSLSEFVAPSADLSIGTHKLVNVLPGVADTDVATMAQLNAIAAASGAVTLDKVPKAEATVDLGGQRITNLGAPTQASDAVTLGHIENITNGTDWKISVRAKSTGDVPVLSGLLVLDGVQLAENNRALLSDQLDPILNGIYVAHAGAWTRATDADQGTLTAASAVMVEEGTVFGDSQWRLITNDVVTVGTTPLLWTQIGAAVSYVAGAGLDLTGNAFSLQSNVPRKFAAAFGNGAARTFTITHNLNSRDVAVSVYFNADGSEVECDIQRSGVNTVALGFAAPPAANQLRCVVVG